ncbi:MAG: hypothetical protein JW751_07570 [Polyangiaceae bacterium]|nr:hypothetical protein [Polyangiaceae bacterium]
MNRTTLRFIVWTVIIVGTLGGLLRAFVLRLWVVPNNDPELGASVGPSLAPGDTVLLWHLTAPRFGELALCEDPENPGATVVGRILAEAGDQITINGDSIVLNGARSGTESSCGEFVVADPTTDHEITQQCSVETLAGHKYDIGDSRGHQNPPPPVQGNPQAEEAYLVSDNRLYPLDSRNYGPVARSSCKEAVVFRLWGAGGWGDAKRRLTAIR